MGTSRDQPELPDGWDPDLFLVPGVKSGRLRQSRHTIWPCGLASDSVGDVTIDGRVEVIQPHPESYLDLYPIRPHGYPSYSEVWFYCDCVAYEHDIPSIVYPQDSEFRRFGYRFIHNGPRNTRKVPVMSLDGGRARTLLLKPIPPALVAEKFFMQQFMSVLEETREMRQGPLTYVLFRHYRDDAPVDLAYSEHYRAVAQGVHLYGTALRQADALSEYLCYYRTIESVTRSNGKAWIGRALDRISTHDFGTIPIGHQHCDPMSPRNLLAEYRKRALHRLQVLLRLHESAGRVTDYLYNVNRCGIAHGQDIVRGEIGPTYFEVVKDNYVLKMLARLAIDEASMPGSGVAASS